MLKLGIDLGGTKIEGVVLDHEGQILFRQRIPTEQEQGYTAILKKIGSLYKTMLHAIANAPHTLGIGTPGTLSRQTGRLKNSNTQCLNGQPLERDLEIVLSKKISAVNDANCFALAETLYGAAQNKNTVFGVILGTGCGGGIVMQGRLHEGLQGIGGEWGHTVIDPQGHSCYCGKKGCVETFISGGGLEQRYQLLYQTPRPLQDIVKRYRQTIQPDEYFFKTFLTYFGIALSNMINILDPDIIVLGGGVSNIDELYSLGILEVKKNVFNDHLETPIVKNRLGDSAGVIGAALLGI